MSMMLQAIRANMNPKQYQVSLTKLYFDKKIIEKYIFRMKTMLKLSLFKMIINQQQRMV